MITITQPEKFAELIAPSIRAVAGSYFLECETYGEAVTAEHLNKIADSEFALQQNEMLVNHVHIFDLISHDATFSEENGAGVWDTSHPDFKFAWQFAKQLAHTWLAKLSIDFPAQAFVVYASKLNDPIVRFYLRRDTDLLGELPQDHLAQIVADEVFILLTPSASESASPSSDSSPAPRSPPRTS